MSLTQYYTATTLDGFIADPDNSLAWLFIRQQQPGGALTYDEFIAGVGAIAMGRTTYEWIVDHEFSGKDPSEWRWPYDVACWVFTQPRPAGRAGCADHVHARRGRRRARRDGGRGGRRNVGSSEEAISRVSSRMPGCSTR